MQVKLTPLDVSNLELFETLLGGPEFGGCFCAVWTSFDQTWTKRCKDPAKPNFSITQQDVFKGRKAGFFVHSGNDLIGWTGAGPKTEFPGGIREVFPGFFVLPRRIFRFWRESGHGSQH